MTTYMWAASRVRLCLPLPPTPSSSPLPSGWRIMRQMRQRCFTASINKTRCIWVVVTWL